MAYQAVHAIRNCLCSEFAADEIYDAGAGATVAVGVGDAAVGAVVVGVVEEMRCFGNDFVAVGAYEAYGAGLEGFGALRYETHHQHRLAERRRFFLNAAAVGYYHVGMLHHEDEGQIVQWFDKEYIRMVDGAEHFRYGAPDVGVEVHRIDEIDIRIVRCEIFDCKTYVMKSLSEILAAVPCDKNEATSCSEARYVISGGAHIVRERCRKGGVAFYLVDNGVECVDYCVAGNTDSIVGGVFCEKIAARHVGGREMESSDTPCYASVHFFRPRGIDIAGP